MHYVLCNAFTDTLHIIKRNILRINDIFDLKLQKYVYEFQDKKLRVSMHKNKNEKKKFIVLKVKG